MITLKFTQTVWFKTRDELEGYLHEREGILFTPEIVSGILERGSARMYGGLVNGQHIETLIETDLPPQ